MNGSIRAVRSILMGNAPLVAALTANGSVKIRPGKAAQIDSPPYVLLWQITDRPEYELSGKTGIRKAIVQVDVYAETSGPAAQIAGAIAEVIESFGRGNTDEAWIASIMEEDSRPNDQQINEGADRPLAVIQTDYRLVYRDKKPPTLS